MAVTSCDLGAEGVRATAEPKTGSTAAALTGGRVAFPDCGVRRPPVRGEGGGIDTTIRLFDGVNGELNDPSPTRGPGLYSAIAQSDGIA
jgi:hypothetical protein